MDSRTKILETIKSNKPSLKTDVEVSSFLVDANEREIVETFCANVLKNDGKFIVVNSESDLPGILKSEIEDMSYVDFSGTIEETNGSVDPNKKKNRELAEVKILILSGILGVAENAAVWWEDETGSGMRILPFIVQKTIFIVSRQSIVPTMHHAYKKLGHIQTGFGSFIAGPSKTGDIEQTLVTGAHGALSHLVLLV